MSISIATHGLYCPAGLGLTGDVLQVTAVVSQTQNITATVSQTQSFSAVVSQTQAISTTVAQTQAISATVSQSQNLAVTVDCGGSTLASPNIEFVQGETQTIVFTVTGAADLTGLDVHFSVKDRPGPDATTFLDFDSTTDPTIVVATSATTVEVRLLPVHTDSDGSSFPELRKATTYKYDLQIDSSATVQNNPIGVADFILNPRITNL